MRSGRGACARLTGLLALLALAGRVAAQTGDSLCDARQSTVDTCVIAADATLPASAFLDASTSSGGCGGTIGIGNGAQTPATLTADGLLSVDGATLGGTIALVARDQLTLIGTGTLLASNTDGDASTRPPCAGDASSPPPCGGLVQARGGTIQLEGARVLFEGLARARGKQGEGGVV